MNIEIVRPYLLVVLPMFILMIILSYKYLARIRKKGSFLLFIRGLIITLLILALCGINISWQKKNTTNIFVLDLSSSAKHFQNDGEDFIREAFKIMPKGHQGGVLVFGEDVLVDRFVSSSNKYLEATSNPIESSTNIQNALTSALALLPENQAKRVILISDGEENEGEAEKLITSFQQQKVDFKVVKVNRKEQEEVYVDNLIVPERIHYGESFNIVANIKSNIKTKADLTLYSGRNVKGTKTVDVQKGDNSFVFKDTGEESGLKNYRVVIEPYIDTEVKNNEYITYTQVQSKPQILLIEGGEGEGNELETIIKASNLDYKKVNTVGTPRTLGEMTEYKSIILANVHADDLNESFKSNLETYVKDYAGGLIVSGGENAFALGGYKDTSIEKVLPVDMELKGEKEIPEMSLIMVIDHSGSMSGGNGYINKLELAKESAIKALDTIRTKDYIGVLAFDDTYDWVVEVQKANDKEKLAESIGSIALRGGTSIYPALEQAYLEQENTNAKIKHIILLTDGQDGHRQYDDLLEKMNDENITLSTVSVGDDSDKQLLENLSELGMGRYYHTDINTNIPRIFAKEVFLSIKEYINNREFYPTITGLHPILNGVLSDNMVPPLYGYIASSPKTNATVILKSDEDDPILTTWQYGLGRTVAWNSDMAGRWSKEYVNWNNNLTMWQNMINWTVENYNDTGRNASINIEGKKGIINYKTENQETDIDVSAICTSEEGIQKEITLDPIKPGEYQGEVKLDHPGFYTVNVREKAGEDVTGFINTAVAMQYSPEYRFPLNDGLLELLVDETYGEFIETPEDIYKENAHKAQAMLDLTNLLLILALILFVIDIAFRRLNINYAKYFNKIMGFETLNKIKGNNDKSKKDTKSNLVRPKVQKQKSKTNEKRTKKINTKNAKQEEKTKVNDLTSTLLDKKKDRT